MGPLQSSGLEGALPWAGEGGRAGMADLPVSPLGEGLQPRGHPLSLSG